MDRNELSVERLKTGCPAAYEVLVDQFEGPLYRFFLCSHGDHHLAQDQSAETFVQLVRSLPTMTGGIEQLRGFVFGIARNVQRRRWRQKRIQAVPLGESVEIEDGRRTPMSEAACRDELRQILNTIRQLDEPGRTVLMLRFVEGLSLDEIAGAMEMPVGTIKSHIHRGRKRLKQLLAKEECEL